MHYLFLAAAILCECGGTLCMKLSNGFSALAPTAGCVVLYIACFAALSRALQGIPLSIAYATWGAAGIIVSTLLSVFLFKEPVSAMLIAGVVVCIAGVVMVNLAGTH